MERSPGQEAFLQSPPGHWFVPCSTAVIWCHSRELAGCVVWGRPSRADADAVLGTFESHGVLANGFDVILDARGVEGVDPEVLEMLLSWVAERRETFVKRIRVQIGVVSSTVAGVTLAGILPVLGETHDFRVMNDAKAAFEALSPEGARLFEQVEAAVREAQAVPAELRALRDLLRARKGDVGLDDAARAIGSSSRSLQRALQQQGTSFRDEVRDARFALASELLVQSDDKVSVIAMRLGLSETALTQLVKDKTGRTPAELRRKAR